MKSVIKTASSTTLAVATLLAAVACDRPMEPTVRIRPEGPRFATALAAGEAMARYTPPIDADGAYLLDRVCDVFIGDPAVDPADGAPQRYKHQTVVDVPPGSTIKLVGTAAMQASGSKLFTCDARDMVTDPETGEFVLDENGNTIPVVSSADPATWTNPSGWVPVIDPVTLHAAKGDAFQINTPSVTVDLNGYSITTFPAFGTPGYEEFENLGVQLVGDNVTLINSAAVTTDTDPATGKNVGVSYVFGFGHNIDIEAVGPTVRGLVANGVYNLETKGGFGIRLSSGTMTIDAVKSVNEDPVEGQGFEARRITSGSLTVSNSYFVGGTEGAFLRELSGITFKNNFVSGRSGPGIATRQVTSSSTRPVVITGNTVDQNTVGILWGRDSRNNGGLTISGNSISRYTTCGIGRSSRNTTLGTLTLAGIASQNTFDRATAQTCTIQD